MRAAAEQRRTRRHQVRVFVDFETPTGMRCEYATTLGAEGMFIETEDPLPKGSAIQVQFRLPGGDRVHGLAGSVVRTQEGDPLNSRAPGMGIRFDDEAGVARLATELDDLL